MKKGIYIILVLGSLYFSCQKVNGGKTMESPGIGLTDKIADNDQHKFRRNITELRFSDIGQKILVEDLEWSTFKSRKAFRGCGDCLSFGAEYVLKPQDLENKGLFFKSGLRIEDYLSREFIDYLKNKKYQKYVKISKQEYDEWEEKKGLLGELSENNAKRLFSTFIEDVSECLKRVIEGSLSQYEYDAIICALYNFGLDYMKNIKFFEVLNSGNRIGAAFILASARAYRLNKAHDIYNYDNYISCSERWDNGNISETNLIILANESDLSPQKFIYGWTKRDFIQVNMFCNNFLCNYQKNPSEVVEQYIKEIFASNNNIMKLRGFNTLKVKLPKGLLDMILEYTRFLDIMVPPLNQNITDKFWYALKNGKHKSWIFTGKKGIEGLTGKYFDNRLVTPNLNENTGPFILNLEGTDLSRSDENLLSNHPLIGGVILFAKNIKSKAQLKGFIKKIKEIRPDILFFVDQEGGLVQRLKGEGFSKWPCAKTYGDEYNVDPESALKHAEANGKAMGEEMKELGIHFDLAPVLDLERRGSLISKCKRAFHENPEVVSRINACFSRGLKDTGVYSVAKHFPGHSCITEGKTDSHTNKLVSNMIIDDLEKEHLKPFIASIKNGTNDAIMPAHIIFPKVDLSMPVSLSEKWLKGYLRKKLGYKKLIISDCLSMEGANIDSLDKRVLTALNAGNDMVIVCHQKLGDILALLSSFNIYFNYKQDQKSKERILLVRKLYANF